MTKIDREISIASSPEQIWPWMDILKWPEFSDIFTEVSLDNGNVALGAKAQITAGPGEEKVNYSAQITAFQPSKKLAYSRSGGPLPGDSEWEILPAENGSTVIYRNSFDHALAEPVKESMAKTMERFLAQIKKVAENSQVKA